MTGARAMQRSRIGGGQHAPRPSGLICSVVFERTQPAVASAPPQSFADFFEAESRRLGRAIYLLTGDAQEAEDLVQEAMARAFERWERVGAMAHPSGYVFTIASNL